MTLVMAVLYSSVPVSHDSVSVIRLAQNLDPETELPKI